MTMASRRVRQIRIEGDIAYVPLTQGYEATIDAADLRLVEGYNWYAEARRHSVYARRDDQDGQSRIRVYLHRKICGCPDGLQVDHIDGDGLNNRRNNLRAVTAEQNARNQRVKPKNKSGFKGVSWSKRDAKWRAFIRASGMHLGLGSYDTPEAAHAAYCKASAELHGEFGRTA